MQRQASNILVGWFITKFWKDLDIQRMNTYVGEVSALVECFTAGRIRFFLG